MTICKETRQMTPVYIVYYSLHMTLLTYKGPNFSREVINFLTSLNVIND